MAVLSELPFEYRTGGTGQGRVARRIAWKRRSGDQRKPFRILVGPSIAIHIAVPDSGLRPPKVVVVLGVVRGDRAVGHCHRQ